MKRSEIRVKAKDFIKTNLDHFTSIRKTEVEDMLNDFGERLATNDGSADVSEWVAVDDRLPDDWDVVMIFESRAKWISTGYWDGDNFEWEDHRQQFYDSNKAQVSHWKPLPEPPCR